MIRRAKQRNIELEKRVGEKLELLQREIDARKEINKMQFQ